jgi:hypothetical protein
MEAGRERWLGDEHRLGGATDIATAGDLEEPLNLGQKHRSDIDVPYGDVKGEGRSQWQPMTHVIGNS